MCGVMDDYCHHDSWYFDQPSVSVVAAVRGHVDELSRMLESIRKTQSSSVEVVIRCDSDDAEVIRFLAEVSVTTVIGPRYCGYASCGVFLNQAARVSRGRLVFVSNHDLVFETSGWDARLLEHARRYPDGMFVLGVETLNAENFPFTCVSRKFVQVTGGVVDERLIYTDVAVRDAMAQNGRAVRVQDVAVRHEWRGMSQDQAEWQRYTTRPSYQKFYDKCVQEYSDVIHRSIIVGMSFDERARASSVRSTT